MEDPAEDFTFLPSPQRHGVRRGVRRGLILIILVVPFITLTCGALALWFLLQNGYLHMGSMQ